MKFEPITSRDLAEIRKLQPNDWSDIIPSISYYIDSDFCYPVKVTQDNRIVAIGTSIVLEYTSWLAHIIVDPIYRKKGIGYQIVEYLLKNPFHKTSRSVLLIATKLGESIYRKAGFRTVSEYVFLERKKAWKGQEVSKNTIPYHENYRSEIMKLDVTITGENRQRILASRLPESILFVDDDRVTGYYLPGFADGLILANTLEAGIELMKIKYATIDRAVLPVENNAGVTFLKGSGFAESKRALRMILGQDLNWKPANIFNRLGGNFG